MAATGSGGRYFYPDDDETLFLRLLSATEDDEQAIATNTKELGLLKARDVKWYRLPNVDVFALQKQPLVERTGVSRPAGSPISACAGRTRLSWVHAGEPLSFWRHEIVALREAWLLWTACQKGDTSFLASRVDLAGSEWVDEGVAQVVYLDPSWGQVSTMTEVGSPTDFHYLDLVEPALHVVRTLVNLHLGSEMEVEFALDEETQRFETVMAPRDLLGVIWLQLADAIEHRHQYRQCDECGKWFRAVSQGGSRRNYCSDACRVRAYRKRKKERLG